jgi:hypothetical protein
MKKLFLFAIAAMLFGASCQQNEMVEANGASNVKLVLDIPELAGTRAGETNMNSGLGAIDNFDADEWAKYDVRYMMEIYDATDGHVNFEEPIKSREIKTVDEYSEIMFEARLIPNRTYRFVVWADFVEQGTQDDLCYDTTDLNAITRKSVVAMDECQDAYFIQKDLYVSSNGISENLVLKRPFGKIRVITTDHNEVNFGSEPERVAIKFYNHKLYTTLNAVTGTASGETLNEYTYTVAKDAPYTEGYDEVAENMTLFADYILAGDFETEGAQEINFTIEVWGKDGRVINSHDFNTQIPLGRNHLTTIVGNLLTIKNDFTISIDDNFDGEYINNWDKEAINIAEDGFGIGELNDNNNYEFVVTAGADSFTLVVPAEVVDETTGNLNAAELDFVASEAELTAASFTIKDLKVDVTRAAVEAIVDRGNMVISNIDNGVNIKFDLYYTTNPNAEYVEYNNIRYQYNGNTRIKVALAAPVVEASVEGNVITLTWEAIEGAGNYAITCGTEMPVFVEETSYIFTGEYETEYTFAVVAVPAEEALYYASAAAEVSATTEVEVKEVVATLAFDNKAKRTEYDWKSKQVWEDNGVVVTNERVYFWTNIIGDYANPARFSRGTTLTVAVEGNISKIVFDCNKSSYANDLKNSFDSNVKANVENDKVTVELDGTDNSFVINSLEDDVRMDKIEVTYIK